MSDDGQFEFVGLVNNRFDFFRRHLILVDQFDNIHAGISQRAYFRTRVSSTFHAPTKVIGSWIRLVLNKWSGHVQCWSGYLTLSDALPDGKARFQWTTKISRTGNACHQQLPGRSRHDY